MKRHRLVPLLILVIILPLPALAWPRVLHDDGGPYRDLAVAAAGPLVAAAVLTPWSIELTVLDRGGQRLAWLSFSLPEPTWLLPRQRITLALYPGGLERYELAVPYVAGGEGAITTSTIFRATLVASSSSMNIEPQPPQTVAVPTGARDLAIEVRPSAAYLIWRTETEDGIAAVYLTQIPRLAPLE